MGPVLEGSRDGGNDGKEEERGDSSTEDARTGGQGAGKKF